MSSQDKDNSTRHVERHALDSVRIYLIATPQQTVGTLFMTAIRLHLPNMLLCVDRWFCICPSCNSDRNSTLDQAPYRRSSFLHRRKSWLQSLNGGVVGVKATTRGTSFSKVGRESIRSYASWLNRFKATPEPQSKDVFCVLTQPGRCNGRKFTPPLSVAFPWIDPGRISPIIFLEHFCRAEGEQLGQNERHSLNPLR